MRTPFLRSLLLATTALSPIGAVADPGALPAGGTVAHGSVGIATPGAGQMTIDQGSQAAIVNWGSFSIGSGARVDIRQPGADAMLLNRVTGATTSRIDGQLNANGQVFLLNPNGITIGPDGQVRAAGFVASSLGMSDEDFLAGRHRFEGNGRSAAVRNHGTVDIVPGGYAALLGGRVENAGTLRVPMGRVGLGSGERMTLDFAGDGFLQVALPSPVEGEEALVGNSGRIEADGGRVEMRAASARDAVRNTVNMSGVIEALSVSGRNGAIVLGGGAGGRVQVSGRATTRPAPATLVAASPIPPARPSGGSITVTGADIVLAGAELDASGPSGGGDIRIGGDLRGAGDLPRARTLAVDAHTVIRADALEAGDGGTVVLWSEDHTVFRGAISSRGGPEGGDGGFVEVSGKARLSFSGLVDRRAPMGRAGTLLLDPYDIVITDIAPSDGGFDGEYFPDGTPSNIFVGDLVENLQFGDTMISTGSSDDEVPGEGSISVLTPVNWGTSSDLRFSAVGNVNLQQAITAPNGGFSIDAGGTITTGPDGSVNVNRFRLDAGSWEQVGPNLPAFSAVDFSVDPFNASFLRARGGSGTAGSPWLLTDAYGLQGVGSLLGGNFALANDIVLAPAASWNQGEGFRPIGADFGEGFDAFSGTFDGSGFAVDALTIDVTETSAVGLFGVNAGEIRNLRLLEVSVNASFASYLGGLVGLNLGGGSITNVEVAGSATGSGVADLGGLVGRNLGTVDLSRAFVTVEAAGFSGSSLRVGGLVGVNVSADTVSRSRASGTIVIGDAEDVSVGGLVGDNAGAIYESRADVDISTSGIVSFIEAGGLVGTNDGTIDTAAATGRVNVAASADAIAGGLVGWNDGSIARAYATGDVFGASPSGIADVGGLVGVNGGTITQALAVGAVGGSAAEVLGTGGLVAFSSGNNGSAGVVTDSFWNVEATGQTTSIGGGTGLTTDELQDFAGFMAIAGVANWSFTQDWSPPRAPAGAGSGQYARLYAVDPVVWVVPADDFAVEYGIPFATFRDSIPYALYGGPGIYVFGPEIGNPDAFATEVTVAPPQGIAPLGRIDAGRYDIEIAGVRSVTPDADTAQDYAFVASPAAFDVLPLNLTIRALDQSKPFGTTAALGTTAFTALLNGSALLPYDDAVTGVTLSSPGAPPTAPEGPYPLTPSDAQGVGLAGNYFISYVPGTLVVLPAADVSPPGQTAATITPPSFVPTVPNPQGTFVNFVPSDHSTAPTPVAGARSQAAADAQQVLAQMEAMAQELELAAQACRQQTPLGTELLDCIASALGSYANALEDIALDLPPELAQVSAIIRQAQEGVQGVRTRAEARLAAATTDAERRAIERQAVDEAVGVVQGAAVEVRRAIELIRADDPQLVRIFSDQGTTVVRALESVEIELVRAIGI